MNNPYSPVWVDQTASDTWYGNYVTVTDSGLCNEAWTVIRENYELSLRSLTAKGFLPVGSPEFISRLDPDIPNATSFGWKQQFLYKGEFNTWLEKFAKERRHEQTVR